MRAIAWMGGYSLVELLLSVSILAGIFLIVSDFYSNSLISYNRNFTQTIIQSNIKQAVETIQRDVRQAKKVEDNSTWPDINSPGGAPWHSTTSTPAILVLATPTLDSGGDVIYADLAHTAIKTDDVVFYVASDNALYRRLVANPDPLNGSKTTCPPASASPACPADSKIVDNIAVLSAAYYDTSNAVIASSPFTGAYSVQLTLQQTQTVFGKQYSSSLTSQASLRNR